MFEELRNAWREAVENFYRELTAEPGAGDHARLAAMRRDHAAAGEACRRIEKERDRARRDAHREREEEAVCRRREELARRVPDEETVRVAAEFAVRHAERAAVLEQVVVALDAELSLRRKDLDEMHAALAALAERAGSGATVGSGERGAQPGAHGATSPHSFTDEEDERALRELERLRRERAAESRLDELKRKMR